jgi:hypothetical protein
MVNIRARQERKKWKPKFQKWIIEGIKAKDQEKGLQDQCHVHEIFEKTQEGVVMLRR